MLPSILLSGFMFPIANMPRLIQYVTLLIPLRYFLVIVRGIFLRAMASPSSGRRWWCCCCSGFAILGLSGHPLPQTFGLTVHRPGAPGRFFAPAALVFASLVRRARARLRAGVSPALPGRKITAERTGRSRSHSRVGFLSGYAPVEGWRGGEVSSGWRSEADGGPQRQGPRSPHVVEWS